MMCDAIYPLSDFFGLVCDLRSCSLNMMASGLNSWIYVLVLELHRLLR